MTADKRADIYTEDGRRIFRASSFGACDRSLVKIARGQLPDAKPEWLTKAMGDSAYHEATVIRALGRFGWKVLSDVQMREYGQVDTTGQLACELNIPGARTGGVIRCHPDGIVRCWKCKVADSWDVGQRAVLEVKVMKKTSGVLDTPFYSWQTAIEMAVTGLPLLFVVASKGDDGELVRDEAGEIVMTVAFIREPRHSLAEIKARVRALNRLIDDADAGEGEPGCTWPMYPCGFYATHDRAQGVWMEKKTKVDGAGRAKLRRMARYFAEAKAEEERAADERKKIGAEMVKLCAELGVSGPLDIGEGFDVTRVEKDGAKRFNRSRAEAKLGALDEFYEQGTGSDYMTVKVK